MWVWGPSCLLSFSPQAWTLQSDEWRADSGHAVQCVQGSGDPSGLFRAVRPTRLRLHPPPLALRQYSHPSLSPITPSVQAFAAFSCDRYGNKKTLDFCCGFFFFFSSKSVMEFFVLLAKLQSQNLIRQRTHGECYRHHVLNSGSREPWPNACCYGNVIILLEINHTDNDAAQKDIGGF